MNEDEIKAALSVEIELIGDMCSTSYQVSLLWNDEVISKSEVEITSTLSEA